MSEQIESPTITPGASEAGAAALAGADLDAARALVLKANPTAIPELVTGTTITELEAAAATATGVYDRILANLSQAGAGTGTPAKEPEAAPPVTSGAAASSIDLGSLSSGELIRRGLAAAKAS